MKGLILLILTAVFVISCQTLPEIKPDPPEAKFSACPSPFLKESYRFVHAIETSLGNEIRGGIIGVTIADPETHSISCAIMTAEGMVLLEAESNVSLRVLRALPPFNSPAFAENMVEDIRLIFFAPRGELKHKGTLADGSTVCRWRDDSKNLIDVIARQPGGIEINKYTKNGSLKRRVKILPSAESIYSDIELSATTLLKYSLKMTLVEAAPLDDESKTDKDAGAEE